MKTLLALCVAVAGFAGVASANEATPAKLPSTVRINEVAIVLGVHHHHYHHYYAHPYYHHYHHYRHWHYRHGHRYFY